MYIGMGAESGGRSGAASVPERRPIQGARSWFLRGWGWPAALMLAVAATASGPAWLGLSGRPWDAFAVGLFLTGLCASGTAVTVIGWWLRARRRAAVEVFRLIIAAALLVWGIGQLWSAADAIDHIIEYPAVGDIIGSMSAPIGLTAVLYMPRRSVSRLPGARLVLDSLAVGTALTFLFWRLVLTQPQTGFEADYLGTGVFVLADCAVFAAVALSAIRDIRARLWATVAGVGFHVVADLGVVLAASAAGPRVDPWVSMSLWCLAWPLIGLGVVRYRPTSASVHESAQDRREAGATQVATLFTFAALFVGMIAGGSPDSGLDTKGSLLLLLLIVVVMGLREVMNTHLRLRLTGGLREQALRDSLTGLPNRRALTTTIDALGRDDVPRVVLTLDLDDFKQVNDLLGHHAGDDLLIAVADALQANSPPHALIARIGGDEFAVLCPGDLEQGRKLADRLRVAAAHALALRAPGVGVSASVGVGRLVRPEGTSGTGRVPTAEHRDQLSGLVESAAALRAAKAGGRNAVQVYDGEVAQARERRLRLENRLRRAIQNRSIITYGQPIVDLSTRRLTGFESLARWTDEELGFVPPDEFIAVAEETGLVVALGECLLEETLAAATRAGVFRAGLTLSVNASPIQLRVPGFVDLLKQEMDRHQIRPDQVIVEITEAILVTEGDPAVSALAEINSRGIGLAIDDFGTGYSALGYLRRLPVQVIKFDKSLTSSLLTEAKTTAIVEGVTRMAHRMHMRVVMEGIEDDEEAAACLTLGADRGQGYLFGRPTPWIRRPT